MKTLTLLRTTFTLALVSLISLTIAYDQNAPAKVRYRAVDLGADNAIGNDLTDSRQVIDPLTGDFDRETPVRINTNPNLQPEDSRNFSAGFVYHDPRSFVRKSITKRS